MLRSYFFDQLNASFRRRAAEERERALSRLGELRNLRQVDVLADQVLEQHHVDGED